MTAAQNESFAMLKDTQSPANAERMAELGDGR